MISDSILISGVGQRLGLHLAQTFLDRGIGIIGTYRQDRDSLAQLKSQGAELHHCDFNHADDIELLIEQIHQQHRSLRAIIHNASEWLPEDAGSSPADTMQRMMQVHVSAPYQLNLGLAPLLQACSQPYADIIHIGDFVSSRGSQKHIAYAASKAAQDNLTLSFASSLAPKIKVNSLAPALILFNEHDDENYRLKALSKNLLHREAGIEEFQRAVDYLLDSEFTSGRILPLDGGRHLQS